MLRLIFIDTVVEMLYSVDVLQIVYLIPYVMFLIINISSQLQDNRLFWKPT